MSPIIIAIDGYSSCGKSTLAKALAKRLGYAYVDTGAMYRAVTLYALRKGVQSLDGYTAQEIDQLIDEITIEFKPSPESARNETYLNGENVEAEIRGKEVSQRVSEMSQVKQVRKRMVDLQRIAGKDKGLVMDGRDIGTHVFPDAELKIFMTADPNIRAQRRFEELEQSGKEMSFEEVLENLKLRDYNDTHRKENPLVKAEDAIVLDNSHLNKEQQLDFVLDLMTKL
jgi:cytidylate kinase